METKFIEIRDEGTCIAAVAFRMAAHDPIEQRFFYRCGYPADGDGIVLMDLYNQRATSDPYEWAALGMGARTMPTVHNWLCAPENWRSVRSGQVVDVRVIRGEAKEPAEPEIMTRLPR